MFTLPVHCTLVTTSRVTSDVKLARNVLSTSTCQTGRYRYVSECEEILRKYGTVEGREGGRGGRVGGGRVGGGGGGGVTEEGENLMINVHAVNRRICCCCRSL